MNDGGPAFPRSDSVYNEGDEGMSLRDWFAGMAMMGINANQSMGTALTCEDTAKIAYRIADVMMKERDK